MIWALVGGLLAVTAAFVSLTFLNRKDGRDLIAARDMIDKEREELRSVRDELAALNTKYAAMKVKFVLEEKLRKSTEIERNKAYQNGVNYAVNRVKSAGIADANRILSDILAAPLGGGVSPPVPVAAGTEPGPDDLIDPTKL